MSIKCLDFEEERLKMERLTFFFLKRWRRLAQVHMLRRKEVVKEIVGIRQSQRND